MALSVVKEEVNARQGIITIRGDTQAEVSTMAARELAISRATAHGLSKPGISGNASIYPVDAEGKTSEDLMQGRGRVAGYHAEWPVSGSL